LTIFYACLIALASQTAAGLGPGDAIRVHMIDYEEGLFRPIVDTFPVEPDSCVYLPYVGKTDVSGLSIPELEEKLNTEFSRYIRDMNLSVVPLYRITVLGHVRRPGSYLVDRSTNVARLIALAQGPTEIGDIGRARIRREGESFGLGLLEGMTSNVEENGKSLRSGDILYVPRKFWPTWSELNIMLSLILASYSIYRIVTTN
jgi:polysaccharide export outer membrane protein